MKLQSIKIIIGIIGVFCVLFMVIIYKQYSSDNQKPHPFKDNFSTHRRRPVSENDIAHIAQWMTFDYINHLFIIPDTFLQQRLSITDSKYPFLTIKQYAEKTNTNVITVVNSIQYEIKQYMDRQVGNK